MKKLMMKFQLPPKSATKSATRSPNVRVALPRRLDVPGNRFFPGQALDDLALQFGNFAALALQQMLDIARALLGQMLAADHVVGRQIRDAAARKPAGQRRSDHAEGDRLARRRRHRWRSRVSAAAEAPLRGASSEVSLMTGSPCVRRQVSTIPSVAPLGGLGALPMRQRQIRLGTHLDQP